jgi:hypothetical protein
MRRINGFIVSLLLLSGFWGVQAGFFSNASFRTPASQLNMRLGDSLVLGVERTIEVKILQDSNPGQSGASWAPDIISLAPDSFSLFWAEYFSSSDDRIMRRDIRLHNDLCEFGTPRTLDSLYVRTEVSYLHADGAGDGNYLVSELLDNHVGHIRCATDSTTKRFAIIQGGSGSYCSQTHLVADTFLIARRFDFDPYSLKVYKVQADRKNFNLIDSMVVMQGEREGGLLWDARVVNPSLAADKNGNILLTATRGKKFQPKILDYIYFNRSFQRPILDSGTIADSVCSSAESFFYDEAPVVSYGAGKFAVSTWDTTGVWLHLLTWRNPVDGLALQSVQLVQKKSCRFTAIAANDSFLVVAWKGDWLVNGVQGIEAIRYSLRSGNPLDMPLDTLRLSDSSTAYLPVTPGADYSELNIALDSLGSIGVVWNANRLVYTSVWANRYLRYARGSWLSPPLPIDAQAGDSVQFFPASLTIQYPDRGAVYDSIEFSTDATSWQSGVVDLSNAAALSAARGTWRYFRYKLDFQRTANNLLGSPRLTALSIPYNVKPRLQSLDSVRIGGSLHTAVVFGDTLLAFSRKDSLAISLTAADSDTGETLTLRAGWTRDTTITLRGSPSYSSRCSFAPTMVSDTLIPLRINLTDARGWAITQQQLYVRTQNSAPALSVIALVDSSKDGILDSITLTHDTSLVLQESDVLGFVYHYQDGNDPDSLLRLNLTHAGLTTQIDSLRSGVSRNYLFRADTATQAGVRTLSFMARDPDSTVMLRVRFGVNHFPKLQSGQINGRTLVHNDSLDVLIAQPTTITFAAQDVDVAAGEDSLSWILSHGGRIDSATTATLSHDITFTPLRQDTSLLLTIHDQFGVTDSLRLFYRYAWFALDSLENAPLQQARGELAAGFSLIVGSGGRDTLSLPLLNSGNKLLHITALGLWDGTGGWVSIGRKNGSALQLVSPDGVGSLLPMAIAPQSVESLYVVGAGGLFVGDGIARDSLIVQSDDPLHPVLTMPLQLEYNDLPRLQQVRIDYRSDRPYWLSKAAAAAAYSFPPHAQLRISFSEPMDSLSALSALRVYSVFDSLADGSVRPIPLTMSWLDNYRELVVRPRYNFASPAFGFAPPPGLFIPTDSLRLTLSSGLRDRATTPSGPNGLDVNRDFVRDSARDSALGLRVDSISFGLVAISPLPSTDTLAPRPAITLTFSGPIYPNTIDTSRTNNSTLQLRSRLSGADALSYDSVVVATSSATFYPARRFYSGDSLTCRYRGYAARDSLGYGVDEDGDGIGMGVFDSTSSRDDRIWGYRVRYNSIVALTPDSGSGGHDATITVSIRFRDPLLRGSFDMDTASTNRSVAVYSSFNGGSASSFRAITLSPDSTTVTLQPLEAFFSADTVFCSFGGFPVDYDYLAQWNLPDTTRGRFGQLRWRFWTGDVGFYTFPVPYKPSLDKRHCSGDFPNAPCGIWFKNLHVLDKSRKNTEVRIAITTLATDVVFDSRAAGQRIRFRQGVRDEKPQWKWDTRNQAGQLVASGIYFFVVYDTKGRVLKKGKLMIVR